MGYAALAVREDARTPYRSDAAVDDPDACGDRPAEGGGPDGSAHPTAGEPWIRDPEETEELDGIESEVALRAAHIHASMQPFLALVARFVDRRGWTRGGHRTPAHWLSYLTSFELGTCREYVRVARALEELPETAASMARGALSYSKVRAITRVARPETEADLLPLAQGTTVAVLERVVRAWKTTDRLTEAEQERVRRESRTFSIFPDGGGMDELRGRLPSDRGAVLKRAIEVASDELYRAEDRVPLSPEEKAREAAKLRADALVLVAERAMAAGFGSDDPKTLSGTRAERYQVMLHVEPETLAEDGETGMSELEDGTRVSAETARRVCCDAGVVRVTKGPEGEVLDVGRKTRTIPPALRRALEVSDRGCRFPGCGLRFTDGHHIIHWADGGETSLRNTILLCDFHHTLVHEGGWKVEWWGAKLRRAAFHDPRGHVHIARVPEPPELGEDPAGAAIAENRARGVDPDAWTAGAPWRFERDIPDEVWCRAAEAAL